MAGLNPLERTHSNKTPQFISQKTFPIAGIITTVYGLEELSTDFQDVACLWLLHPRLQTNKTMDAIAIQTLDEWNQRLKSKQAGRSPKGLIAVSFDQRNHGTRKVDELANEAWRNGNPRHAQDMFSCYRGTAVDTSLLLSYLPAYAFPTNDHTIVSHHILGVSLGGHAAWHCILHEPRISTAVVVIGCPDYTRLMVHRAEKSKLKTWTETSPPGSKFLGSPDFPDSLIDEVRRWDPAGFLGEGNRSSELVGDLQKRFGENVRQNLSGKRILNLSGGADKLVPYDCGKDFLHTFKSTVEHEKDVYFEDVIFDGVGHEMTPAMADKAVDFLCETLAVDSSSSQSKSSKI